MNTALCAPEDGGGAGGQQQQQQAQPHVPPWGADANAPWVVGDKPWTSLIPEEPVRQFMDAKKYANPVVAATALYSATKMLNEDSVRVPGPDAKPEDWQGVYKKLGALDAPDKYEFKLPEGAKVDDKLVTFGKTLSHKLGLNPTQANMLASEWTQFTTQYNNEHGAAETQRLAAENEAALNSVKTKWGAEFDSKIEAGKRVATSLYKMTDAADKAMFDKIEGAIGSAAMLELFARIGDKTREGSFKTDGGGVNDNPDNMAPETAAAEIKRLQGDEGFTKQYMDAKHPQHAVAVERMNKLYAKAGALAMAI